MEQIMDRPSEHIRELEEAISRFIISFELVFGIDWDLTKSYIADDCFIRENGTFIQPDVSDESNNWWNRGSLLSAYRHLIEVLEKN
jgi:Uma2 family endonuclease